MFDLSWAELLLIAVVALFAFGPDDIPKMMYNAGKMMRRIRYMRYALTNQFENFMDDIEHKSSTKPTIKQDVAEPITAEPNTATTATTGAATTAAVVAAIPESAEEEFDEAAADEDDEDLAQLDEPTQNDRPDQPDQTS